MSDSSGYRENNGQKWAKEGLGSFAKLPILLFLGSLWKGGAARPQDGKNWDFGKNVPCGQGSAFRKGAFLGPLMELLLAPLFARLQVGLFPF